MPSILIMTSSVKASFALSESKFSSSCAMVEAPKITVLTLGLRKHQATANCAMLQPSPAAIGISCLTISMP